MKKIILISALLEIIYLTLSLILAEIYGQWSYIGEIIRTLLRVISIAFFAYYYQSYFYNENHSFKAKEILTPQFIVALLLFLFFAVAYTNAENETLLWQIVFGSIFIHTGSIVFTAVVHGLYDSILSINLVPFRLNNGIIAPVLFLIMLSFLILLINKPAGSQQTDSAGDSDQDNVSLS